MSHRESIVVLIPKEGKDIKDIKNWRPITLSNCDAKIIPKALSSRMTLVVNEIIVNTQTDYVKGRSGIDNLRSIQFFTDHCKEQQVESVLVSLDAKMAFDSVDHGYGHYREMAWMPFQILLCCLLNLIKYRNNDYI